MKKVSLETRVLEDMEIMREHLERDGEVPATVFFHFDKTPRKIANLMNQTKMGKMPVKNGFFYAITDGMVMENRREFMAHLGTIFAAMTLLGVMDEPKQIVFCAEAFASVQKQKGKKKPKMIRPSEDPNARDVYIAAGTDQTGKQYVMIKEKKIKMIKDENGTALRAELVPINENDEVMAAHEDAQSPLIEIFFETYNQSKEKMKADKSYEQFQEMAQEDPTEAFNQGMQAAIMMTKMSLIKQMM
jgi:hypothetical protein